MAGRGLIRFINDAGVRSPTFHLDDLVAGMTDEMADAVDVAMSLEIGYCPYAHPSICKLPPGQRLVRIGDK